MAIGNTPKPTTIQDVLEGLSDEEVAIFQDLGMDEVTRRMDQLTTYDKYKEVVRVTGRDTLTPRQSGAFAAFAETLGPNMTLHYNAIFEPADEVAKVHAVIRHEGYERRKAQS